jgi:hypothetical protein
LPVVLPVFESGIELDEGSTTDLVELGDAAERGGRVLVPEAFGTDDVDRLVAHVEVLIYVPQVHREQKMSVPDRARERPWDQVIGCKQSFVLKTLLLTDFLKSYTVLDFFLHCQDVVSSWLGKALQDLGEAHPREEIRVHRKLGGGARSRKGRGSHGDRDDEEQEGDPTKGLHGDGHAAGGGGGEQGRTLYLCRATNDLGKSSSGVSFISPPPSGESRDPGVTPPVAVAHLGHMQLNLLRPARAARSSQTSTPSGIVYVLYRGVGEATQLLAAGFISVRGKLY